VFKIHSHTDKNFIVFQIITDATYPDRTAQLFLEALAKSLYNADPTGFKREPQQIEALD